MVYTCDRAELPHDAAQVLPSWARGSVCGVSMASVDQQESFGGGGVVTACGTGLSNLGRAAGQVEDISAWIVCVGCPWEDGSQA